MSPGASEGDAETETFACLEQNDHLRLGEILFNQASYRTEGLVGAAIVVSALAFAADLAFGGLQRALTPRGLRVTRVPAFEPDVTSAGTAGAR